MWRNCALAFCLGGLLTGAIVSQRIDRTMRADYVQMTQIRVAYLAQAMVDTCFFDRLEPEVLEARLAPAGFRAGRAAAPDTALFTGLLVDRLTFVDAEGGAECSALLGLGLMPSLIDTCRTAIEFNRSFSYRLAREERRNPYLNYDLVHRTGLADARTNQETCHFPQRARAFTWSLHRDGVHFDITLNRVTYDDPLVANRPAYQFSIRRVS